MRIWLRLFLVVLSAGCSILVFPPFAWSWLAVVAWVPLLLALKGLSVSKAFFLGLLHGVLFYGVTLSWLVNIFSSQPIFVVPLIFILALFTAIFARGFARGCEYFSKSKYQWLFAVFAAVWWGGLEFVRCELFVLKFPWMSPGVGLGPMWLSPILGVYAISFVLLLGGALVCGLGRARIAGGVILAVMLVSSLWHSQSPEIENPIKVLAVQSESMDLNTYKAMTEAVQEDVDLIIWPEYGIPYDARKNEQAWKVLLSCAAKKKAVMVVGTQTVIDESKWHNTALTLDETGELGVHYKNHTVHFFDDGVAGTEAAAAETHLGKIGTPICFDCDYEDVIRKMVKNGAEFLAIPSMDAIHWSEREHYQHGELFRHRAAENARWMVISSTSGMTQIIDPYGNRVKSLPLIEEGVLLGQVASRKNLTFYTKYGWLFPWILLLGGCVWLVVIYFLNWKNRRETKSSDLQSEESRLANE